jgi:hypothetical protein
MVESSPDIVIAKKEEEYILDSFFFPKHREFIPTENDIFINISKGRF